MIVLNKGLEALLHSLLPAALRESLKPNTAAYIRARALTTMLIIVSIFGVLSLLVMVAAHALDKPALLKNDLILVVMLALLFIQTWLFYHFNNAWISGLAFTNFYLVVVIAVIIVSGGYGFDGKNILLTCPIISFAIGGRQEGIQNAVLCIVVYWVLVFLAMIDFNLPNLFYAGDTYIVFGINWIFSVGVIATTLMVYESELQNRNTHKQVRAAVPRYDRDGNGMSEFSKWAEETMHTLLPAALRQTLDKHSVDYVRAQILTVLLFLATAIGFFTAFLLLGIDLAFHPLQLRYDVVILIIPCCLALQTWLFYKINNWRHSSIALGYFISVVIIGIVLLSGGYDSPILVLMFICPVGFFMLCGMREGVFSAILIIALGIVLAYLKQTGFVFTDYFHDAAQPVTAGIAWFVAVIAIMLCMMTYDTELEKL